jgi:hypothetical protein
MSDAQTDLAATCARQSFEIDKLKAINAEMSIKWEAVHSGGEWWIADAKSGDLLVLISGPEKEIAEEIAEVHNAVIIKAKEAK